MFDMPNRFDVYLHDTPDQKSVQPRQPPHQSWMHPGGEAARIGRSADAATVDSHRSGDRDGQHHANNLPAAVPVFVVYQTAFADTDGRLQFRPDFYGRDAEIWQNLDPERQAVAERRSPGQRGG